jgi:hypothetical protein
MLPPHDIEQFASGVHWSAQSAEPEQVVEQSPSQVKSQDELPEHVPVEFGPSTMLQSEEGGQTALQLALHCKLQVD